MRNIGGQVSGSHSIREARHGPKGHGNGPYQEEGDDGQENERDRDADHDDGDGQRGACVRFRIALFPRECFFTAHVDHGPPDVVHHLLALTGQYSILGGFESLGPAHADRGLQPLESFRDEWLDCDEPFLLRGVARAQLAQIFESRLQRRDRRVVGL